MAGTTRKGTPEGKPNSERSSRGKGAKARSTAQRESETKCTERQVAAEDPIRPESSASVPGEERPEEASVRARTPRARPQSERSSRVKGAKAGSTAQSLSETRGSERQGATEDPIGPESSAGVLEERPEEAPLRARTPRARPKSERRNRVTGAKAGSTAQRLSETKGPERQAAAEETKRPESSASVLGEARPEEAQRNQESETSVADYQPVEAESVEVAMAGDRAKGLTPLEPRHLESIHEEAPPGGSTLLEMCMSNPSFRARVISHLIRRLG